MKILSASQIREADQHTIQNEPIASIDLMERAVSKLFESIQQAYSDDARFVIFCGKGNNGGDGLALARLLFYSDFHVRVVIVNHSNSASDDFAANLQRLQDLDVTIQIIESVSELSELDDDEVVVDAMLGSGLSRPLNGLLAEVVRFLNTLPNEKLAIDISTGLFADDNSDNELNSIFKADTTLSFQCPKKAMLHRETAMFSGEIEVLDIGLDSEFIASCRSDDFYVSPEDVYDIFKPRQRFSYKGTYGHALLIAGSYGTMGAALMSGRACLRSGAGLLTAYVPRCGVEIFQSQLPEAMVQNGAGGEEISGKPDLLKYNALGMGPGIGTSSLTADTLKIVMHEFDGKMVLDADALNILGQNIEWLKETKAQVVLTPHIGEFRRLLGVDTLGHDYLEQLRNFAKTYAVTVVLKDTITCIATTEGELHFMDYGTPALAKGGSGDVLTGIVLGLMTSGYEPLEAAKLAVYLHGIAAHFAADQTSLEACMAKDVIDSLGAAFRTLY